MGKEVIVDATGVWIPVDRLQTWFGLNVQSVRKTLTHTKSRYKGPPWKALGFSFVKIDSREYCVLDRGIALALWKNMHKPMHKHPVAKYRGVIKPLRSSSFEHALECAGDLMPNQRLIARWVMKHRFTPEMVAAGIAVCYIVAGAGTGKTHTGIEISRRTKGRTLVIASRNSICKQWRDAALDYLTDAEVILYNTVTDTPTSARRGNAIRTSHIVVATPAAALRFDESRWREFSLVIFDEVHQFCADLWKQLLRIPVPRLLGLTATPHDRPDTLDCVAYWRLGRPVFAKNLPGFDDNEVVFRGHATILRRTDPSLAVAMKGAAYVDRVRIISECPNRANDIANEVMTLLKYHNHHDIREGASIPKKGSLMSGVSPETQLNVIVFAERRNGVAEIVHAIGRLLLEDSLGSSDNGTDSGTDSDADSCADMSLENLEKTCAEWGVCGIAPKCEDDPMTADNRTVMGLKGGATEAEINAALGSARVVVTTYSYSSVGVSLDRMNAMVVDSVRLAHFYQIIRRIMRAKSDTSVVRRYIHFVDDDFAQVARRRKTHIRVYKSIDVEVDERSVSFQD